MIFAYYCHFLPILVQLAYYDLYRERLVKFEVTSHPDLNYTYAHLGYIETLTATAPCND